MKKIKFFALTALFCAMGINAFAVLPATGKSATKLFTFDFDGTTLEATITGFVSELDAEFKTSVAIPATVTHPSEKDGDGNFYKFDVVGIAEKAFAGEPISTISFFAPATGKKGIETIGAGAFAGTNITTLDLSNTKITTVNNLFGTEIKWESETEKGVVNNKLTSVTLPATWTSIATKAFENCTALATINFGTATATTQAFAGVNTFAGCPITALNFTGTKITSVPATLLYDGTKFKGNASLTTVTLTAGFTALNTAFAKCTALATVTGLDAATGITALTAGTTTTPGEFQGDAALATINTKNIVTFGANCFDGCAALATVNIAKATTIGKRAFAGTALTSVEFPAAGLTAIGDQAFFECGSLTTATLAVDKDKNSKVAAIGEQAFAYSGITAFTVPATTTKLTVGEKAFAGTPIESFTWNQDNYDGTNQVIPMNVFYKCSDVTFNTTKNFITNWTTAHGGEKAAPTNSTFSTEPPADTSKPFTLTAYSTNPKKFYTKWYNAASKIQVKKSECKVYAGFLEGDKSLGLIQYKADKDGMITIGAEEAVLIVTNNSELKYTPAPTAATSTSWMGISDKYNTSEDLTDYAANENALKYCTAATTRGTLESQLADDTFYIYGWVKAGGFQKITSGTTIPAGTLFAFAKEPVGGRMTIKWYDENGNLEAETTAIESEATAINGVKAAEAEGQRYNVAGQKVSASYKGLVIKDGKKYMQK